MQKRKKNKTLRDLAKQLKKGIVLLHGSLLAGSGDVIFVTDDEEEDGDALHGGREGNLDGADFHSDRPKRQD